MVYFSRDLWLVIRQLYQLDSSFIPIINSKNYIPFILLMREIKLFHPYNNTKLLLINYRYMYGRPIRIIYRYSTKRLDV